MRNAHKLFSSRFIFLAFIGVGATAFSAAKQTPKALRLLEEAEEEHSQPLSLFEKAKVMAPAYISTAIIAGGTIFCIGCGHRISVKNQLTLASSLAFISSKYEKLKDTVEENFSEEALKEMEHKIAEKNYDERKVEKGKIRDHKKKILYYEAFSGRYFWSTELDVLDAMYKFNRNFQIAGGERSIAEFFDFLGLKHNEKYEAWGFSADMFLEDGLMPWIDFYSPPKKDDSIDCITIDFQWSPELWNEQENMYGIPS